MQKDEGLGSQAPDGSWVELYRRLPSFGEADVIDSAVTPGSSILELGAGTGRVTHDLLAKGHKVVAVDQSVEMLNHVRGAETVVADIETLNLVRTFDVVVLASNLVNTLDPELCFRLLESCARHVKRTGSVLIQRYPSDWDPRDGLQVDHQGIKISLRNIARDGRLVRGTVVYASENFTWEQAFVGRLLSDTDLAQSLHKAGLIFERTLDSTGTWIEAKPSGRVLDNKRMQPPTRDARGG